MKKIIVFLVFSLVFVSFFACDEATTTETTTASPTTVETTISESTITSSVVTTVSTTSPPTTVTTLIALSVPDDITITENFIAFSPVVNATKYQLKVRNLATEAVMYYYVNTGFNLRLVLSDGNYAFQLRAVGNSPYGNSEYSSEILSAIADPDQTNELEGSQLENFSYISWLGRTHYDEVSASVNFYFTGSGFEVGFYGTELTAQFLASRSDIVAKQPHLTIFVDGEENPLDGITLILDGADKTYTLVSGLEEGYHRVRVMKRSEAIDSNTALTGLFTDGYFQSPGLGKQLKFQFIAASSSTGYGNLATTYSEPKTTANSHGLLGFPYLVSYMMDAECVIFAASGWGVTRGWNTGGSINEVQNIPNGYDYVAIDGSNVVLTGLGRWDQTNYIPDVVVVNLGTNDFNASGYSSMTAEQKTALETRFVDDYTAFILRLNNYYPDAIIIVAYGLMGDALKLGGVTQQVVDNAQEITDNVYIFLMPSAGAGGLPYGSDYHPSVQTHIVVAEALASFIESITDLTRVRNNITWD